MKERVNIVYSKSQEFEGAETTQDDPITLIGKLESRGFTEVAICGGSSIYTMFLKAGIVDEIYLTTEPVIFGRGMPIFTDDINVQLQLLETHSTEHGTIFAKYKVLNRIV
jgi:dihydrofolate reductase